MAKATQDQFEQLVEKAAMDLAFRDALIVTPIDAAKTLGIDLDAIDVEQLDKVKAGLLRFGGNVNLHPRDAIAWSVGLLSQIRVC